MAYFLDNHRCNEMSMLFVFQHLYQLKGTDVGESIGFYYFSPRRKFEQEERVRGGIDLLITSIDSRVVDGAEGSQGYEDNSSDSDNISHELKEVMDIDALIGSGHKRRKTSVGAAHINPSSKEEGSGVPLKRSHPLPLMMTPPLFTPKNSLVAPAVEREPIEVGEDFSSSLCRLLYELGAVGLRYMEVDNKELIDTKVACGPFDVHKMDFDALVDVDMGNLSFDIFNPFGST
ncbi:hypothetical protein GOBAR_AA03581 [Gossypium barbadense]|uniref:Uncharacterized protein n=1 Tax=Gossypium barbadense TaxID=3634 RepID=A0A2P5YN63_GOSBA|nr:hypothetical protein GOBAR_AA03581 [Gossypium barbadense]